MKLYIGNLTPNVTEDQLRELFQEHGEVIGIELFIEERPKDEGPGLHFHNAIVTMGSEKTGNRAMHSLNGHELDGQRIAISPIEINIRPLMKKQQQSLEAIIEELGEAEKKPRRMLEAVVLLCGVSFAEAILEETLEIEAKGGLAVADGSRQRTPGGVFFYLARFRMSPTIRGVVYNRKGKLPNLDMTTEDNLD